MRILVVTDQLPYPLITGARVRIHNMLRRLAGRHEFWLASLIDSTGDLDVLPQVSSYAQVVTGSREKMRPVAHLPGLVRYGLAGVPLELKFEYSKLLAQGIRRLVARVPFDIIQFEPSKMALYLDTTLRARPHKRLMVFHDVAFSQYSRIAQLEPDLAGRLRARLYAETMRRWEPGNAARMDGCIAVSHTDRQLLTSLNPRLRPLVVPNGVDTRAMTPLAPSQEAPALLFVGTMRYEPCADAALFFAREVLPRIRRQIGPVDFWIVGMDPPPQVVELGKEEGIHVTGRVESVHPYYARSSVCVVPLRAGSGTRLKILEAMALGRPVVSTSIGREGLDAVDGEHLLVADDPGPMADAVVKLLKNQAFATKMVADARAMVESRYDWDGIAGQMEAIYEGLAEPEGRGAGSLIGAASSEG